MHNRSNQRRSSQAISSIQTNVQRNQAIQQQQTVSRKGKYTHKIVNKVTNIEMKKYESNEHINLRNVCTSQQSQSTRDDTLEYSRNVQRADVESVYAGRRQTEDTDRWL